MTINGDYKYVQTIYEYSTKRDGSGEGKKREYFMIKCVICGTVKKVLTSSFINNSGGTSFSHSSCINYVNKEPLDLYLKFNEIYAGMLKRCYNRNCGVYDRYGGRGIEVKYPHFIDFYLDMWDSFINHVSMYGSENTTLDRLNNDGHYEPGNVAWRNFNEQARNRSNTIVIQTNVGTFYSITALSEYLNMNRERVKYLVYIRKDKQIGDVRILDIYKLGSTTRVRVDNE